MTLQQLAAGQKNAQVPLNENFQTLEWAAVYGRRHAVTTGLTWGYYGGIWNGFTIADGTLTLTNSAVNYVVVTRSSGAISASTAQTNWLDTGKYARVYALTVSDSAVTVMADHRAGLYGIFGMSLPDKIHVEVPAAMTFALADLLEFKIHPSTDTTARTWTIPANASVPFPIGSVLEGLVVSGAGAITIEITSDTLRQAGTTNTGSRTVAANGQFKLRKVASTLWYISGEGIS